MKRTFTLALSILFSVFMAILAVYFFSTGNHVKGWVSIGGLLCGVFPLLLFFMTKLEFNVPLIFFYYLFLFASLFLGSILHWYALGWWDDFLHFTSGILLGFTGIALFERMIFRYAGDDISAWFIFLFILGIAALGGALWEIFEFSCDHLGHTHMQFGNTDTMSDLIDDTSGGLVVAFWSGIKIRLSKRKNQREKQILISTKKLL